MIMKKFEISRELQKMTQKHNMSKYSWKNGVNRFAQRAVATNLQFVNLQYL